MILTILAVGTQTTARGLVLSKADATEIGQNVSRVRIVKKESVVDDKQEVYALVLFEYRTVQLMKVSGTFRTTVHLNEGMKYKLGAAMTLCHVRVFLK